MNALTVLLAAIVSAIGMLGVAFKDTTDSLFDIFKDTPGDIFDIIDSLDGTLMRIVRRLERKIRMLLWYRRTSPMRKAQRAARTRRRATDPAKPPRGAKLLARFVMKPKDQEVMLGDLEELYNAVRAENGVRTARIWYYWQVVRSALPMLWSRLVSWGVIAAVVKAIKHVVVK